MATFFQNVELPEPLEYFTIKVNVKVGSIIWWLLKNGKLHDVDTLLNVELWNGDGVKTE